MRPGPLYADYFLLKIDNSEIIANEFINNTFVSIGRYFPIGLDCASSLSLHCLIFH